MPLLDVSEVLADPMFADTITVQRVVETVDAKGRSQATPQTFSNIPAVVTAATGDALQLLPETARMSGNILVHTTFILAATSDTTRADVIVWQGRSYTVTLLNDWSTYGAGFHMAVCTLKDLVEASP